MTDDTMGGAQIFVAKRTRWLAIYDSRVKAGCVSGKSFLIYSSMAETWALLMMGETEKRGQYMRAM